MCRHFEMTWRPDLGKWQCNKCANFWEPDLKRKPERDKEYRKFLWDLADRLMHVPATYGVDQGDVDTLLEIANSLLCDAALKKGC